MPPSFHNTANTLLSSCALLLSLVLLLPAYAAKFEPLPEIEEYDGLLPWAPSSPKVSTDPSIEPLPLFDNATAVALDVELARGNHQEQETHLEKDSVADLSLINHKSTSTNRDAPTHLAGYLDLRAFQGKVTLAAFVDDQAKIKVTRMSPTANGNFLATTEFETLINGNAFWRPQSFRCLSQHQLTGGNAYSQLQRRRRPHRP